MTGCVFWAAEYCFLENPSVETMISNMQLVKPTVFISIPKKWMQIYDYVTGKVDIEVEDHQKIGSYIKAIAKFKNKKIVSEELYESIFNEIRDVQSSKKNSYIENKSIDHPREVLEFDRHITKNEINTLLISRLIGVEVFSSPGIPIPFLDEVREMDTESIEDLKQECNQNLSRAFFDKNGCATFWKVSEFIILHLRSNPTHNLYEIYDALCTSIKITTNYLTRETVLYMISLVMSGVDNES
jgi:hypothetical protein